MELQPESIYAVLITLITVLGSAGAWRYYEKRALIKKDEDDFIREDCAKRIDKLEALLEKSSREKDEMREKILQLTKDLAELTIKVKYLEMENKRLLDINNEILKNSTR